MDLVLREHWPLLELTMGLFARVPEAQCNEGGLVERRLRSQSQTDKVGIFPIDERRPIIFLSFALNTTCFFFLSFHPFSLLAVSFTLCYFRLFSHATSYACDYSMPKKPRYLVWKPTLAFIRSLHDVVLGLHSCHGPSRLAWECPTARLLQTHGRTLTELGAGPHPLK